MSSTVRSTGVGVELRGVSLAYGPRLVLHDLSFDVRPGERVCVLGPNGAGKSSLLRCVTGIVAPREGSVSLGGVPIVEMSRGTIARRVAVVPGQVQLPFAMAVRDVVALGRLPYEHPFTGPGPADRARVEAALARVGITELADRDARELSLGERQLVLLCLALAQEGGLLVLDEPTVHLDLSHQVRVMELLRELSEKDGVTVLAVLHDLTLAAHFFPRLVLLDGGRLVADGPPASVLTPERIREVYRVDPSFLASASHLPGLAAPS